MGIQKIFRNDFPTAKNTNSGVDPSMDILVHLADDAMANHLNGIVAAIIAHEDRYGTDLEETGTHAKRLADLEATSGTDEKVKATTNDTTQGFLGSKLSVTNGLTITVLNPAANEVLQLGATFGSSTGEFCEGDDSRLSDARTPLSHAHAHVDTTGQGVNDHHDQAHVLDGGDHTVSGLTIGHVMTALSASTVGFQAPTGGGATTFIALTDTPSGHVANKWLKTNSAGTAIEQVDEPAGGSGSNAPGVVVKVITAQIAGAYIDSGASYVQFYPDTTGSETVVIPYAGTYNVDFTVNPWARLSIGTSKWKVVIDEGESYAQTIGDIDTWQYRIDSGAYNVTFNDQVVLTAGSHTLKGYFKTIVQNHVSILGAGTVEGPDPQIVFHLVSGSGVGGLIVDQFVLGANFITSSATFVTVTDSSQSGIDMAVSATVIEGERVEVKVKAALTFLDSGDDQQISYGIKVDSDDPLYPIMVANSRSVGVNFPQDADFVSLLTEPLSAGTHTFTLVLRHSDSQQARIGGHATPTESQVSVLQVVQYRGGLVPIYNEDDVLVQDKPTSWKISGGNVVDVDGQVQVSLPVAVTAPGVRITMLEVIPSVDRTTTSASFVDITELDNTFDVPYAGYYDIVLETHGVYTPSGYVVIEWQLVFDTAGTPQTVGSNDNTWITTLPSATSRSPGNYHGQVYLSAGSHTVNVQWKRSAGAGTPTFSTIYASCNIYGTLISGSGAGGILPIEEQILGTSRTISSSTAAPIPTEPMTITFDANEGEIVTLGYKFRAKSIGGTRTAFAQMRLDGTLIGNYYRDVMGGSLWECTPDETQPYLMATGGTHILDLYIWTITAETWEIQAGARLWAMQYRGGLVPIYDASGLVQDKPSSWKILGGAVANVDGQVQISLPEAVTTPGFAVSVYGEQQNNRSGNYACPAGWVQISPLPDTDPGGSGDTNYHSVTLDYTALYRVEHAIQITGTGYVTVQLKIVLDEGLSTEIVIGATEQWIARTGTSYSPADVLFVDHVTIPAGTYTLKFYGQEVDDAAWAIPGDDDTALARVTFTVISGSGAGGILPVAEQTLGTQRQITAITAAPIPDEPMTITFDAPIGEVVKLGYSIGCYWGVGTTCLAQLRLDGNLIGVYAKTIVGGGLQEELLADSQPFTMTSSGTHTLNLYLWTISGQNFYAQVGTRLWAEQHRGGLVPYYDNDGILVQDKPTSLKAGNGVSFANVAGQVVITSQRFIDPLDDDALHDNWTIQLPGAGSVTEQNGRLEIGHTGGTTLDWNSGVNYDAPGAYLNILPQDFSAKVFVANVGSTSLVGGMLTLYEAGDKSKFIRIDHRYGGSLTVNTLYNSTDEVNTGASDGMWIALMRRGRDITVLHDASAIGLEPDINDMTFWRTITNPITFMPNRIGLHSLIAGSTPAATIHFNNFSLIYP